MTYRKFNASIRSTFCGGPEISNLVFSIAQSLHLYARSVILPDRAVVNWLSHTSWDNGHATDLDNCLGENKFTYSYGRPRRIRVV